MITACNQGRRTFVTFTTPEVRNRRRTAQDVTDEVVDMDARIAS